MVTINTPSPHGLEKANSLASEKLYTAQEEPGTLLPTFTEETRNMRKGRNKRQPLASHPSSTGQGDVNTEETGSNTPEVSEVAITE